MTETLSAPANVKAVPGDGAVSLSWSAVIGASEYGIYLTLTCDSKTGADTYRYIGSTSDCTYNVAGLTNGQKYYFVVRAFDGNNGSKYDLKDHVEATPKKLFTKSQNLKATAGDSQVTLTWDKLDGVSRYAVYSNLGGKYTQHTITNANAYTVTGLVNGTWSAFTNTDLVYATPVA